MEKQRKTISVEIDKYEILASSAESRIAELEKLIESYEKAEEALNNELEQLREVTIPYLAQIIQDLREQLKANTALNVGRQILFGGGGKKEYEE